LQFKIFQRHSLIPSSIKNIVETAIDTNDYEAIAYWLHTSCVLISLLQGTSATFEVIREFERDLRQLVTQMYSRIIVLVKPLFMDTLLLLLQDAPMKFTTAVDSFFIIIAPHLRKMVWSSLMEHIDNKLFYALVDANMISCHTGKLLLDIYSDIKALSNALHVQLPQKCEQIALLLLMNKFALSPVLATTLCPKLPQSLIVKLIKSYKPDKLDLIGIPPELLKKI